MSWLIDPDYPWYEQVIRPDDEQAFIDAFAQGTGVTFDGEHVPFDEFFAVENAND